MAFFGLLDRWLVRLYAACGYLAAFLLVSMGVFIVASIVTRLIGTYIPGLTEYSGYAMAGTGFLALAYTFQNHGHIRVGLLLNTLHGRNRHFAQLWCLLAGSAFSVFLAFYMVKMTYVSWQLEDRSEGADAILLWIPQTMPAFGALVLAICVLHNLIKALAGGTPREENEEVKPAEMAGDT